MDMEFKHGLETAKKIVDGLWGDSLHKAEGLAVKAKELREKAFGLKFESPERLKADEEWADNHQEWSNLIAKIDVCQQIYESINREIAKARDAV